MELNLKNPIIFFDLETTGINVAKDRIVEISLIKILPNGKEDQITKRINPEMPIPAEVTEIHGITDADVADAPLFKDFAKKNLILVLMDFPRPSNQTDKQKKYNNNIAGKYKIQLFPTVLLLDSKGKVIAQTDYDGEDAKKYIELLKSKIPAKK